MAKSSYDASAGKLCALFNKIRKECASRSDAARAGKYERLFTEGYDAYGIDHLDPGWLETRRDWVENNRPLGLIGFLKLGDLLVRTGNYEEAMLAIHFISQFRAALRTSAFEHLGTWFDGGIQNWAETDVMCCEVLDHFLVHQLVPLAALESWRESEFKYRRRAVPVMMLPLLDITEEYGPLPEMIRPMMMDPEKKVQQGLGWFLREAWRRKPKPVEAFLLEHKDTSPRVIFQYATKKMSAEQKQRFRKTRGR